MTRTFIKSIIGVAVLGAVCQSGHAAVTKGVFELTGANEVPANTSTVVGHGEFSFNDEINRLTIVLNFVGASIDLDGAQTGNSADDLTGAYVHSAPPGAIGGIVFDLMDGSTMIASNGLLMSIWEADEGVSTTLTEQVPNLLAGDLYVNVNTNAFPTGEVRGQIVLPATVPEPATSGLVVGAVGALFLGRRRRR